MTQPSSYIRTCLSVFKSRECQIRHNSRLYLTTPIRHPETPLPFDPQGLAVTRQTSFLTLCPTSFHLGKIVCCTTLLEYLFTHSFRRSEFYTHNRSWTHRPTPYWTLASVLPSFKISGIFRSPLHQKRLTSHEIHAFTTEVAQRQPLSITFNNNKLSRISIQLLTSTFID